MALKPQLSFSSGELDPILHDRVTLERFQNGLATARNVMIGKHGTLKSRFATFLFHQAAYEGSVIRVYYPPNSNVVLEFGHDPAGALYYNQYIKIYDLSGNVLYTYTGLPSGIILFREEDLPNLHFVTSGDYVYVFKGFAEDPLINRYVVFRIQYTSAYTSEASTTVFTLPSAPASASFTIGGTGYNVDYSITYVKNGEESTSLEYLYAAASNAKKPIAITESNVIIVDIAAYTADLLASINEVRIYQRPTEGAAYGFLGRTTNVYQSGARILARFTDVGADADFANGQQSIVSRERLSNSSLLQINTGVVYQQRLLLANLIGTEEEAILASRPGFQNNLYRDFPYSADSALNFKAGTSGNAKVLRMVESEGLVVFTSIGVFVNQGVLNQDNIVLHKRGNFIIDENVPPLVIPGGLFFVDKITSTVRQLVYSQELGTYTSVDHSIFSDHLFKKRTITSWAYQDGAAPMIIVVFSDGTFATFTYNFEHQMKAWTRHDSVWPVEQVEGTDIADTTIFVINKNGNRYIEMTVPRATPPAVHAVNPEAHLTAYGAFMDGLKVKSDLLNDDLVGTDTFLLATTVAEDWEADLWLTCGTSAIFTDPGPGTVGEVHRFFNPKDKSIVDLEIITRYDDHTVVVRPSEEFPLAYASDFRLYQTHTLVDGLEHLEGEEVSILSDGNVISSPLNDSAEDNLTSYVVTGGSIELEEPSAITIVGRPIVADIKTLNVSTVEQSPTMIESLTVNKLYMRTLEARGLFVDNKFPEDLVEDGTVDGDSVDEMQSLDTYYVPSGSDIIGNRSKPGSSRRHEIITKGTWDDNGQISIRSVDPLHFEILSIIADIEVLKRSDR